MTYSHTPRLPIQLPDGIKSPVATATTENITLRGLQIVNGYSLNKNDRVLVKNQDNPSENGIYSAQEGNWVYAQDWKVSRQIANGVLVLDNGTGNLWRAVYAGVLSVGVTEVNFTEIASGDGTSEIEVQPRQTATDGQTVFNTPLPYFLPAKFFTVYVNSTTWQRPDLDFTIDLTGNVVFSTGLSLNDTVDVTVIKPVITDDMSSDVSQFVTFEEFGGVVNAVDNTDAMNKALIHCGANNIRKIYATPGVWKARYLNKTFNYLEIEGGGSGRPGTSVDGSTRLEFIGTGNTFISNGVDDGLPWDDNLYNGPQGLTLRKVNVYNGSSTRTTQLECTKVEGVDDAFYSPNSAAIRDWRGGNIHFTDVFIEGFDYSFWGINSDFNKFSTFTQAYSKRGVYLGPRSDQSFIDGFYSFICDSTGTVDVSSNHKIHNYQSVICGSGEDFGFRITKGSSNVKFYEPWLENYSGVNDCIEFFDVGSLDGYGGNTTATLDVQIINPLVAVQVSGDSGPNELLRVSSGERIVITDVTGARGTSISSNIANYFHIPSGVNAAGMDLLYRGGSVALSKVLLNNGTGIPNLTVEESGNQWKFSSQTGRLSVGNIQGAAGADELRITQNNTVGRVSMEAPQKPSGQTRRLDLFKAMLDREGVPTSGEYEAGDYIRNQNVSLDGSNGSKYLILGWIRITTGSLHVLGVDWIEHIVYAQNPLASGAKWTLSSVTGRLSLIDSDASAGADELTISQENIAGRIQISTPNLASGQIVRLDYTHVHVDRPAKPTEGSWVKGDWVSNSDPVILGSSPQYIVLGWKRMTTGSAHVLGTDWAECRTDIE